MFLKIIIVYFLEDSNVICLLHHWSSEKLCFCVNSLLKWRIHIRNLMLNQWQIFYKFIVWIKIFLNVSFCTSYLRLNFNILLIKVFDSDCSFILRIYLILETTNRFWNPHLKLSSELNCIYNRKFTKTQR